MNRWSLLSASLLFSTLLAPVTATAQTSDVQYRDKKEENDMSALRRWLQDKRFVSLKETGGDLSISGEVRTECQFINEKKKAQGASQFIQQRGEGSSITITDAKGGTITLSPPNLVWDVEFNLILDYRTDRAWAAMKVEFDNDMGTRSGTVNKLRLEKAYLGGRLIAGDTLTWDAEIGRRNLSNVFDSKVEFGSLFDGLLFRFGKTFQDIGDFYTNLAGFLIDDRFNSYGEALEIGALGVANTGLNVKYSIINWYKPYPASENPSRWRFLVNQFLVSYQMYPEWLGKRYIKFYSGGLINALAQDVEQTGYTKQRLGCYAGMAIGVVKKARDWAVDVSYQWIQAQVIPDIDASGIGRGNSAAVGVYSNPISGGAPTTEATAVGNGNFKGFEIEALYAFTDNVTLLQNLKISDTLNKNIGPNLKYKQWEVEIIY